MAKKGGRTRSGFALGGGGRRLGSSHNLVQDGTRPAIDIADWLRRTVRPDDFVVVKMDIEGAEYDVVPHLLREKVADLIDELFLEIHTETNTCCKPPHDAGRHRPDAMRLLQAPPCGRLRALGGQFYFIYAITALAREPVTVARITNKQTHAAPVAPLVPVGVPGAAAAAAGADNWGRRLARRPTAMRGSKT